MVRNFSARLLVPMGVRDPVGGPPLYFFASYARLDSGDGPFLARFFDDLSHEVRVRSGHRNAAEVGFIDVKSIRPGDTWSQELGAALARCRTFVALCSPTYFASEYCGREWSVIEQRVQSTDSVAGAPSSGLLPVIWTSLRNPPPALSRLQYDHSDLGKEYARSGLRYLLQLKRNRDDYQDFLVALSERIVRLAEESPLPPMTMLPHFDTVPNAFDASVVSRDDRPLPLLGSARGDVSEPESPADGQSDGTSEGVNGPESQPSSTLRPEGASPPAPVNNDGSATHTARLARAADPQTDGAGPRRVTFVLAVTSAHELRALRQHLDYYGNQYDEWMPYHPDYPRRVCIEAQLVAANQEMTSAIVRLDTNITRLLERSRARNEIVVFIIDLWTATITPYREALAEYDRRNEPTTGVLVPWNSDDAETRENAERLTEALADALPNNMLRQDHLFRMDVGSHEEFGRVLEEVLVGSQARIFARRATLRGRPAYPRPRPILNGP